MAFVSDKENPADFLTKWVPRAKLELSLDYVTNRKAVGVAGSESIFAP